MTDQVECGDPLIERRTAHHRQLLHGPASTNTRRQRSETPLHPVDVGRLHDEEQRAAVHVGEFELPGPVMGVGETMPLVAARRVLIGWPGSTSVPARRPQPLPSPSRSRNKSAAITDRAALPVQTMVTMGRSVIGAHEDRLGLGGGTGASVSSVWPARTRLACRRASPDRFDPAPKD